MFVGFRVAAPLQYNSARGLLAIKLLSIIIKKYIDVSFKLWLFDLCFVKARALVQSFHPS